MWEFFVCYVEQKVLVINRHWMFARLREASNKPTVGVCTTRWRAANHARTCCTRRERGLALWRNDTTWYRAWLGKTLCKEGRSPRVYSAAKIQRFFLKTDITSSPVPWDASLAGDNPSWRPQLICLQYNLKLWRCGVDNKIDWIVKWRNKRKNKEGLGRNKRIIVGYKG